MKKSLWLSAIALFISLTTLAQWTKLNPPPNHPNIIGLANKRDTVFIGTNAGYLFYSADSGANWINIPTTNTQMGPITSIGVIDKNRIIVGTKGYGAYYTINGGLTWYNCQNLPKTLYVTTIFMNGNNVYMGSFGDAAFYTSSDGGQSWIGSKLGDQTAVIYAIGVSGNDIYAAGQGMFRLSGGSWQNIWPNSPATIFGLAINNNKIFAGTYCDGGLYHKNGLVYKSDMPAASYEFRFDTVKALMDGTPPTGIASVSNLLSSNTRMFLTYNAGGCFYGFPSGFYQSDNNGVNWNKITSVDGGGDIGFVEELAATSKHVYVLSKDFKIYRKPL